MDFAKLHEIIQSRAVFFGDRVHVALQENHVTEIQQVQIRLKMVASNFVGESGLSVMRIGNELAHYLGDFLTLFGGEISPGKYGRKQQRADYCNLSFHSGNGDAKLAGRNLNQSQGYFCFA